MKYFPISFTLLIFLNITLCISVKKDEELQSKNLKQAMDQDEYKVTEAKEQRLLATTSDPFKLNYVILSWIKKYPSRNDICYYLCQPDSFWNFTSTLSCYASYNCTSKIWENFITFFLIITYGILPIFMILLGVWNFRCFGDNIAILTGIVILNSFYQKVSRQFEEDMETDYDISSSEIESEMKNSEVQSSD